MYDSSDLISLDSVPSFGGQYTSEFYYSEQETTSFSTEGTVQTSDGREISFQVDVTMSRSFTQYMSQTVDFGSPKLVDPLVINLDAPAADVQDQKFYFDLDADGHEEAISQLGPGSGFLALDKNGDGIINDGSELFGALSGNGFAFETAQPLARCAKPSDRLCDHLSGCRFRQSHDAVPRDTRVSFAVQLAANEQ